MLKWIEGKRVAKLKKHIQELEKALSRKKDKEWKNSAERHKKWYRMGTAIKKRGDVIDQLKKENKQLLDQVSTLTDVNTKLTQSVSTLID